MLTSEAIDQEPETIEQKLDWIMELLTKQLAPTIDHAKPWTELREELGMKEDADGPIPRPPVEPTIADYLHFLACANRTQIHQLCEAAPK